MNLAGFSFFISFARLLYDEWNEKRKTQDIKIFISACKASPSDVMVMMSRRTLTEPSLLNCRVN